MAGRGVDQTVAGTDLTSQLPVALADTSVGCAYGRKHNFTLRCKARDTRAARSAEGIPIPVIRDELSVRGGYVNPSASRAGTCKQPAAAKKAVGRAVGQPPNGASLSPRSDQTAWVGALLARRCTLECAG